MRTYDHVEKLGRAEVEGIDLGEVYVYPKIDGTNARVDVDDEDSLRIGSRKRVVTPEDDNAGFAKWCHNEANAEALINLIASIATSRQVRPKDITIYGEWLVPHTLKTYRDDAWKEFYMFDVHVNGVGYLHPDHWQGLAMRAGFQVIRPLQIITNPSLDQLIYCMNEHNTFLIQDGQGVGEGIVLKNYRWQNEWGRQPWAKIVRNEFKEKHVGFQGPPELRGTKMVELEIAAECVTEALIQKEIAKIEQDWSNAQDKAEKERGTAALNREPLPRGKLIPALLGRMFHCVVTEDIWTMVKKHKNPTISFKKLQQAVVMETKRKAPELF